MIQLFGHGRRTAGCIGRHPVRTHHSSEEDIKRLIGTGPMAQASWTGVGTCVTGWVKMQAHHLNTVGNNDIFCLLCMQLHKQGVGRATEDGNSKSFRSPFP